MTAGTQVEIVKNNGVDTNGTVVDDPKATLLIMKFTLEIGDKEKHWIDYYRNWFFGTERLRADGEMVARRSVVSPSNYVSIPLCRRYEFSVGTAEPHTVVFEKERPLLMAGFRPHKYRVFVDGKLVHEREGF